MEKIAFFIGPLPFYWYGLILSFAILAALLVTVWQARLRREDVRRVLDLFLYGIPIGFFFARLYYVFLNWQLYVAEPARSLSLASGGFVLDGALASIVVFLYFYAKRHRLSVGRWLDIAAPGLALGHAIGLWARIMNEEGFGRPTDSPRGFYIDFAHRPETYQEFDFFEPVCLYSSGWSSLLFLFLLVAVFIQIRTGRLKPGSIFLLYIVLFSLGRFIFEGLRLDLDYVVGLPVTQIFSGILGFGALALFLWLHYQPVFSNERPQRWSGL
ncbi:MAG: prolipoprotein diacylglyceryl transferase [Firmicutes bacterium]|nr:prolipoprotein diacylglyceryl transferase [Bacillota bacterium]